MRWLWRRLLLVSFVTAGYGQAIRPEPPLPENYDRSLPVIDFEFSRPGLPVAVWAIEIGEDGKGRYREGDPTTSKARVHGLDVNEETHKLLLSGLPLVRGGACETREKHIANTGKKTLAYGFRFGDIHTSCTFNYSDQEKLNAIAAAFQALAQTEQIGEELQHQRRFDRLGLDAEVTFLEESVKSGRAIELQNIAPVLRGIVEDDRVMERVRRKVGRLLEEAGESAAEDAKGAKVSPR